MLTGLHIPALAVACGCILLAATLLNSRRRTARAALCVLAAASAALYFDWRFDHDGLSPFETDSARSVAEKVWAGVFLGIEILCTFELAVFLLLMSRTSDHRDLVDQYEQGLRALPPDALPPVDVWIATYNEEWPILEKTVVGALNLDYPKDKLRIYVLDDGRRNWLRDRCAEMGVVHVTRPDNRGKKAGNHNHALAVSASPFILSLDADFVPYSNFLFRVLGFFQDPKVAIVQTPQTYYNVDVVRSALRLDGSAPDELACFYREIQPSRDAWDAAFYCGSCALLRRSALEAVGGFETRTDVEDQATSVRLLAKGYVTRYLNEQLSVGLSAESLAVMHDQRNRWCRGSMQIAFLGHGPFGWGMGFIHRLLFSQTTWITWSIAPLVYAVSPMTLWMFGWKVYPAANPTEVLVIPLLLFISLSVSIAWLSRLHWTPIASPATMLFLAVELVPTALSTLIKPFGKPLVRILPVTPKGASAAARRVDLRTFSVLAAIIVLTLGSFVATALAGADPVQHPDEVVASVFWTMYTLVVLTFAALTCFERPYRRGEERFPVQQPAELRSGDQFLGVLILDISVSGARIETGGAASLRSDDRVELGVLGIGTLPGIVVRRDAAPGQYGVKFDGLAAEVRHRLIRAIFTDPVIQVQAVSFSWAPIFRGLLRRFVRPA
jgi:cellulose synthase (UDP-forming)